MRALFENRTVLPGISLALQLAAFPLVSFGTTSGPPTLWWVGLAALGLGGAVPPVVRVLPVEEE